MPLREHRCPADRRRSRIDYALIAYHGPIRDPIRICESKLKML